MSFLGLRLRFRFGTSSLLWLMVVVAAFFVGRQSEEIGQRLSQLWNSIWPSASAYQLVQQPNGRLLIVCSSPVARLDNTAPNVCVLNIIDGKPQYEVLPLRDGNAQLTLWQNDGQTIQLNLVSKNGTIRPSNKTQAPTTKAAFVQDGAQ